MDSLTFLHQVPNWRNYFYHFPPPSNEYFYHIDEDFYKQGFEEQKYIVAHLSARDNGDYELEKWYRNKLIKKIYN